MIWGRFALVLVLGLATVAAQGIASWFDGYLTQAQMQAQGVTNGWSFLEHGGMWADALIISPILAYILAKHTLRYMTGEGAAIFVAALLATMVLGYLYQQSGLHTPGAHAHDGKTTLAGILHGVFATFAIWTFTLVYLRLSTPAVSKPDIVGVSLLLMPFFFLGVAKLSERWVFMWSEKLQVGLEILAVWIITLPHLRSTSPIASVEDPPRRKG